MYYNKCKYLGEVDGWVGREDDHPQRGRGEMQSLKRRPRKEGSAASLEDVTVRLPGEEALDMEAASPTTASRQRSERVCLNLSGTRFVTTRDTLTKDSGTYFAAMLRMRERGEDGVMSFEPPDFFIDRDPTHFRYILNYMRDGRICLDGRGAPHTGFLEELLVEAQFYNLSGLCDELTGRLSELRRLSKELPSGDKDYKLVTCEASQLPQVFHRWIRSC
jgi:hypothetical protein